MLRLRPYIPSDAQTILSWIHDETSFHKWCADKYDRYPIEPEVMNRAYAAASESGAFFPMTAFDDDGVRGHLILRYPDADRSVVRFGFVIVDDAARGTGCGREMLSLALRYAFSVLLSRKVTLGVFADNEPAARCYRAVGFTDIPRPEAKYFHVMGEDWECLEMEMDSDAFFAGGRTAAQSMRRRDRLVTDMAEIRSILLTCKTAHVAMVDNGAPYVLPLSYGFELSGDTLTLWFHSAKRGRKLDILHRNDRISFAVSSEGESALSLENPCNSGYYFACVQGNGHVEFITDAEEKCRALTLLMERQAGAQITFTPKQADAVCIFRVVTRDFTAKRRPRPENG